ncbi:MAG: TonB-dependent receptor [Candidatus Marinimicrobia bacterium]|nr:TonB-dependent receptor [Candidatus Neomarinimicrobiota bacterium]
MRDTLRVFLVLIFPVFLFSADQGKIAGTITDETTGEPLVGANILVEGTSFGAATDNEGRYRILGVPVKTYVVRAEFIGYRTVRLSNVKVTTGLTTTADFALSSQALEAGVIDVVAQRPLVSMSATNAVRNIDSDQIANLATRDVTEFFNLQAGVVVQHGRIHVRGSRSSEVGYELEGASTRGLALVEGSGVIQNGFAPVSASGGGFSIWNLSPTIPEALEQITLQSGGYTADLGGANAGIVQQKLKTGGSALSGSFLMETDAMAGAFDAIMPGDVETYSYGANEFTGTLGGPITPNIRFFGAYQMQKTDDYAPQWWEGGSVQGGDSLAVTDASGTPTGDLMVLDWDGGAVNGRSSERNVFNGTLLFDFNPLILRLGMATSSSSTHMVGNGIPVMFNLERQPQQDDESRLINLKTTYFLSDNTLLNFNVNSFHYYRHRYDPTFGVPDDLADVLEWGDSAAVAENGVDIPDGFIPGPDFNSFDSRYTEGDSYIVEEFQFQRTGVSNTAYRKAAQDYLGFSGGLVSQMNAHEIKAGFEYRKYTIRRYNLFVTRILSINQSIENDVISADSLAAKTASAASFMRQQRIRAIGYDEFGDELDDGIFGARHPVNSSIYFNDKIELRDIVVNVGLRYDIMALDDATWKDPDNPAYDANRFGVYEDELEVSETKSILQPRLGLAFPLSDNSVFHLQYGKFAQFPELATTYKGAGAMASVFGGQNFIRDPIGFDLDPVVTNQFEVGFSYEFLEGAAFDVTAFTRNTVGQVSTVYMGDERGQFAADQNLYNIPDRTLVYTNGDFTATSGVEFSLVTRRLNRLQTIFNYTWTDSRGTNSYPNSLVGNQYYANMQAPTMIAPLMFQLKHKGTMNLDYRFGNDEGGLLANSGINMMFSFNSGHPFTKVQGGFGQRGADEGALLNETDPRNRVPVEPLGNSTTPWVFNSDMRVTKGIAVAGLTLDAYVLVTNLFNARHVLDVYARTGDAYSDGFLNTPELSEVLLNNHPNGVYQEMYQLINLENRSHYRRDMGADLFGTPRQVKVGLGLKF